MTDVIEFLEITSQVFNEEQFAINKIPHDSRLVNYLAGKILQKSKGQIKPELAMKVVNIMIESQMTDKEGDTS